MNSEQKIKILSKKLEDEIINSLREKADDNTRPLCGIQEKPTAQTAHLVFADTKANAEKTKRAVLCQRSTENDKKEIRKCLK